MSACYDTAVWSCCQEENKTKELILLTKKQPKANFSEIAKLTTDIKNLHKICCEGNTVACALGRDQLMNYTCSNQAILSSKFAQCCEQPEPFRGECIINSENDDKPSLPSLALRKFTEDQSACKQFSDKQDDFLQEFLYEYSRRHLELAVPVILRILATYKHLLEECCKLGNPLECHRRGKAPQLSVQELVAFTRKMAAAASRCCPLSNERQSACVEDADKLILGALCRRHDAEPVNAGVGRCCDSYAFRKPCFDDLPVDGTYVPPPLSCDQVISLKEDLCRAQEEELQTEKQKAQYVLLVTTLPAAQYLVYITNVWDMLLSNLVKQKPQAAEDAFQAIGAGFTQLVEMCCHSEKQETCFQEEVSCLLCKQQRMLTDWKVVQPKLPSMP
ncbi:hypothetical protein U0070_018433 [Myodes glareolus]|uniref:Albumin domain-containing protein n=1 Tax=Myodes glareolus TaxID=447135 RepID=A0AAW0JW02_MYOGA